MAEKGNRLNGKVKGLQAERIKRLEAQVAGLTEENEKVVGFLEELTQRHNMSVQQMSVLSVFFEWYMDRVDERSFEELAAEVQEKLGIELERDHGVMVPDKRIIVPGGA